MDTVPAGAKPNSCCYYALHMHPQAEGYLVNYHEFAGPHIVSGTGNLMPTHRELMHAFGM